jgi:hypothetical protein
MSLYARTLELIPSLRLLAPLESVEQFGRAIAMQLDFTIEAQNNIRFARKLRRRPEVMVPEAPPGAVQPPRPGDGLYRGQKILDCKKHPARASRAWASWAFGSCSR